MANGDGAARQVAPYAFGARISLVYSAIFFHIGLYLPYFPLWLKAQGLSATQISIILSLPLVVRVLVAGQITAYADRAKDRVDVAITLYAATTLAAAAYLFVDGFWPIFAVTAVYAVFFNPVVPVIDSLTLSGVRRFGVDYGRIRLWGSLVFVVANLGGGLILADRDVETVLRVLVASVFLGAFVSPFLPRIGRPRNATTPTGFGDATTWQLLANRRFLLVMLASGMLQASHALIYGFGSIYWESLGFSGTVIGALWAVGVVAEIALFQFSRAVLPRTGALALIVIGGIGAVVRWTLMPLGLPLAGFFALQCLHGLSFGAVHLGTMHFLADTVAEERMGAAQGASFVLGGMAMAIAVFFSGPIYAAFGVNGFLVMAVASGVALVLVGAAMRAQPHNSRSGGDTAVSE
ncbi:MAG: MFS transporter [Salaquimonas sp.]|jgi:PPP family 3-phenylpropionic acid transporter|nr:MFS transporter [Salaquimonas sp.]